MNKYATPAAILILAAVLFVGLFDVSFEIWHGREKGWRGTWQYAVDQCVSKDVLRIGDATTVEEVPAPELAERWKKDIHEVRWMVKSLCEANGDALAAQIDPKGYKERWRYEGGIVSRLR